jgi:hypothetical protein
MGALEVGTLWSDGTGPDGTSAMGMPPASFHESTSASGADFESEDLKVARRSSLFRLKTIIE